MSPDPRETLASAPMSALQILVVAVTIGLTALDGFDVLSISFASPGIASEWGIDRGALGIVLSMELIGMGFGSVLLGSLADRIGRRPTILGCLVLMAAGMLAVTSAHDVTGLATLTILLTAAYFFHVMTFYFILKWVPKIVVDMGFAPSAAGGVLVWANVGGAAGALSFGLLAQKIDLRRMIIAFMLASTAMVILFGRGQADLSQLALVAGIAGFFTNAVIVGLYA